MFVALNQLNIAFGASGASTPWTTYQMENFAEPTQILGPDYSGFTAASEASDRRCVRLNSGSKITFISAQEANGFVVRYSIPDENKTVTKRSLLIQINGGVPHSLPITQKFMHLYGGYPFADNPALGSPRRFWDEARILLPPVRKGDKISIRVGDGPDNVMLDLVDLEQVGAPKPQPTNSISVFSTGAHGRLGQDDSAAFKAAIARAEKEGKTVWVPPGNYTVQGKLSLDHVKLQGAGMWFSTLNGGSDYRPENRVCLFGAGSKIGISDLAIRGQLNYRSDTEENDGICGSFGSGSRIENVWVEHTKVGAWLVNSDGLVVQGCRFRDTIADGINLCLGMRNTKVRNCSTRGTGDDGFAMWPATYAPSTYKPGRNVFERCTAELPFLAQGFAIYGGEANKISDCLAKDVTYGAGILISSTFPTPSGFEGTTVVQNCQIMRSGWEDGAVGIFCNLNVIGHLQLSHLLIRDAVTDGLKVESLHGKALSDCVLTDIDVEGSGFGKSGYGLAVAENAVGGLILSGFKSNRCKLDAIVRPPPKFYITKK